MELTRQITEITRLIVATSSNPDKIILLGADARSKTTAGNRAASLKSASGKPAGTAFPARIADLR